MVEIKAIRSPAQLRLRRWDFQFSIRRLLLAMVAAYAEVGQFDCAVAAGRQSVELASPCLRGQRERRLARYQAGQPWRSG